MRENASIGRGHSKGGSVGESPLGEQINLNPVERLFSDAHHG